MIFRKNMKIGVSIIFLLLIFSSCFSLIDLTKKNNTLDENALSISAPDDPYEPNNNASTAFDLTSLENIWLSSFGEPGIQLDIDWYNITIMPGKERLIVNLLFWHIDDNLDIVVLDLALNPIVNSTTFTDNEYIDYILPTPGLYHLVVYGSNVGNKYDLLWSSISPSLTDDFYEPNDFITFATNITSLNNTWLSSYNGLGIKANDDWYEILIPSGFEHIMVDLIFCHANGDIDIEIWDGNGPIPGASSTDVLDNEFIDFWLPPGGGVHYIHIYYDNFGNTYDLRWVALPAGPGGDDPFEPNNDYLNASVIPRNSWITGIQSNEDWYEINVEPGTEQLIVDLMDYSFDGNLGLEVYDAFPSFIDKSDTPFNNEHLEIWFPSSGVYYIRVYGLDLGTPYDLWWNTYGGVYDDQYELNNHRGEAYFLGEDERTWLSDINGSAVSGDEDWYLIDITPGFRHLRVDLIFDHSLGNIDITIFDESNSMIPRGNYSFSDNEYVDVILPHPGLYFVQIHGYFNGNEYNLWWDDLRTDFRSDDNYEENDDSTSAYYLSEQHKSLWNIQGLALQYDNDWYEIDVKSGFLRLRVAVFYDSAEGVMGLEIYDHELNKIADNFTMSDNEYIDYVVPSNGTYYIRVFGDNTGNTYNLFWEAWENEEIEMIPGYDLLIMIVSIIGISMVVIKMKRSKFKHQ